MNTIKTIIILKICFLSISANFVFAQLLKPKTNFTQDDSLRGTLNENRNWWNVKHYNIAVTPDYNNKSISGVVQMQVELTGKNFDNKQIQIDLQQPLTIDKILINKQKTDSFYKASANTWIIHSLNLKRDQAFAKNAKHKPIVFIDIYYHGKPKEAKTPPWDGGWIWKKDEDGNPWMTVAVQGIGASAWYPCKDHQSDEPELGANITIHTPDTLMGIANGKLIKQTVNNKMAEFTWQVKNPINNYCIVPYIGKYKAFTDTFMGIKGKLDINYWVLPYNLSKAKKHFKQVKPMLRAFEYWLGAYPFYEDGYQLVESPHLGMEHQSAIAYGNNFLNGYMGKDRSGNTGWGLKWDFIIVHESGHEWFANNITAKDIADMWIHESFTTYTETLFVEYYYGKKAADAYNFGQRRNILNDKPIIGPYGVNKEGSSDMYDKGSNMIHTLRHALNNDSLFRQMLINLNSKFYHSTVTTQEIENFIINITNYNWQAFFNQYLRTTQIPVLIYHYNSGNKTLSLTFENCVPYFTLPIWLEGKRIEVSNTQTAQINFSTENLELAIKDLEKLYYIQVKQQ